MGPFTFYVTLFPAALNHHKRAHVGRKGTRRGGTNNTRTQGNTYIVSIVTQLKKIWIVIVVQTRTDDLFSRVACKIS